MFRASTLGVIVYITFVLTSNHSTKATENNQNSTTVDIANTSKMLNFATIKNKSLTSTSDDKTSPKHKNDEHMLTKKEPSLMTEGGPVKTSSNSISSIAENQPKKSTLKIVPRKGANLSGNVISTTIKNIQNPVKISFENTTEKKFIGNTNVTESTNKIILNENITKSTVHMMKSTEKSLTEESDKSTTKNISSITVAPKKHKPKPTVTVGKSEDDKPIRSSSTAGRQRKIDYIIPIVISVITLPLLSFILYVLYRRGRDCWDKRHYRRMDFLIDGMYNE